MSRTPARHGAPLMKEFRAQTRATRLEFWGIGGSVVTHSIAQNAIEWGTHELCEPLA
jgi:hypothetical protein